MRSAKELMLDYLTPVEERHEPSDIITHVLFGECESGNCKSCQRVAEDKQLGRLACSCDCHHWDNSRHKAGVA